MIHFQGKTAGAALRPSEVKPKLDRFLQEWCRRNDILEKEQEGWKTNPARVAYDYKMRIYAGEMKYQYPEAQNQDKNKKQQPPKSFNEKLPSYFGELKQEEDRTNLWHTDGVKLEIICFHEGLRKVIRDAAETFFVLHNFGNRQNRGIGGFTLQETTPKRAEELLTKWFKAQNITVYKMVFGPKTDAIRILKCGNMFYQILKGGINDGRTYIKSCLTKYFLERCPLGGSDPQLIGGEKRWMKQPEIAISPAAGTHEPPFDPEKVNEYRYIRGLLGTVGNLKYQDGHGGWQNISVESSKDKKDPDRLERVSSPIRYKLVGNVLFVIPLRPGKDLLGQGRAVYEEEFTFYNTDTGKHGSLKIPKLNAEFTMNGLMQWYIKYITHDIPGDIMAYASRPNIGITLPQTPPRREMQWIQICR